MLCRVGNMRELEPQISYRHERSPAMVGATFTLQCVFLAKYVTTITNFITVNNN